MTDESTTTVTLESIPDSLAERPQWVCWRQEQRDGKPTKIPVVPDEGSFASSTDSETWADVETALDDLERGRADGIGFVFTEDDPLVGVDLDDCRDPETGTTDDDAKEIITRLDSYTEISPSGTGYHVLVQGSLPGGRNRRGKIECYDSARFFTVTGTHVTGTPTTVAFRQDALDAVHREYIADEQPTQQTDSPRDVTPSEGAAATPGLDDDDLVGKARAAANGRKFTRLWNGTTTGYESHSEADMALCCMLAFWSGGDDAQMDRLFRQSGLIREKWDEQHYAHGATYGEKTIERAIEQTAEFYDPASRTATARDDPISDDDPSNQPYLTEKNRLLRERVTQLEARLEERNKRIDELEAKLECLAQTEASYDEDPTAHTQSSADTGTDTEAESASLWGRTKRLFQSGGE